MDGFQAEALKRLPLAQAVFHLFSHVLDRPHLEELFQEHRGRCYERELSFAEVVYLLRDALLVHEGSGNASFTEARQAGALEVTVKSVYEKLGRFPLELSLGLLRQTTTKLLDLLPEGPDRLAASLSRLTVIAFDGKKIKKAAKRLKALRGLPGKMLGGKLLAAMHVRAGLALAISADPDGERNDVPLVPDLVQQVRGLIAEPILWMGDRQFGNLDLPALLSQRQDHFLLRCTTALKFHPDPQSAAQEGADPQGRRWVQQWGWIGNEREKRRRYVRQIILYRPGEKDDVILITDLLDEARYPAGDLLAAYLLRWDIECMFQKVTEVFDLQKLIGSTPQAMIFQSAFCFVLYNLIEVIRAYVADGASRPVAEVSTEKLFDSVCRQLVAWNELGEPACAAAYFTPALACQPLKEKLRQLLSGVWTDRWIKATNKKPRRPQAKARVKPGHGGHSSVWRILQAHKQQSARP
jgi:Transposase DDE domain